MLELGPGTKEHFDYMRKIRRSVTASSSRDEPHAFNIHRLQPFVK